MKSSFEIPIPHIKQLKANQDFDFTLAQHWITSELYRSSYDPGSVMDNGAYETGQPMEIRDLRRAASLARPSVVIAPDWINDNKRTRAAYKQAMPAFDCEVAAVVCGPTVEDMCDDVKYYLDQSVDILAFPFRLDRLACITIMEYELKESDVWIHLLGAKSLGEVQAIRTLVKDFNTSVDTSKPIKAAIYEKGVYDDLRGYGHLVLQDRLDEATLHRCVFNMNRWRSEVQNG